MDDGGIGDGRIRWFGEPWGAHINDDCDRVPVPVGGICLTCNEPIEPADRGVMMVYSGEGAAHYRPMHVDCFCRSVGIVGGPPRKPPPSTSREQYN